MGMLGAIAGDVIGSVYEHRPVKTEAFWPLVALEARFTDDTVMALGIVEVLRELGSVDQDRLARVFARRYRDNPLRGYGGTAHEILAELGRGISWREVAPAVFEGQGSKGNGGAMRVAPVGAYFADDYARAAEEARKSQRRVGGDRALSVYDLVDASRRNPQAFGESVFG